MTDREEGATPRGGAPSWGDPGTAGADAQILPPLYARWIGSWLGKALPTEKNATCSNCAMCAPAGAPGGEGDAYYSPVTKCCTYLPELANFLVGRVLSDEDPEASEGRASVERRIAAGLDVTPHGLGRTRLYTLVYENSHEAFGRAAALECPHHLADGRCGVWKHRESTCATWFCKHERGQLGKRFWRRLHDLLTATEVTLSRHCLLSMGMPVAALEALIPPRGEPPLATLRAEHLDGKVDAARYQKIWGAYAGRETEFYRKCERIVDALGWDQVLDIGGADLKMQAELTRAAHARLLSEELPARPRAKQLSVLYSSGKSVRVATYSSIDPLSVPKRVLDVIHRFDGRPTAEALADIATEDGVTLSTGLVRKLADFGVIADE